MSHWNEARVQESKAEPQRTAVGLWLFAIYSSIYAAFVFISAFQPKWMAETIGGVNLAVISGFGLIIGAVVMAASYLWLCRSNVKQP